MSFEADLDLSDWQRSVDKFSSAADDKIRRMLAMAAETVGDDARRLVPRGPSGRARASLRVSGASVVMGDSRTPYAGWLSFGGVAGRRGARRGWVPGGRYIWPAWLRARTDILTAMKKGLADAAREAGL